MLKKHSMLDVKSLAVDFYLPSGKVTALKDISFTVSPGETLALVGESGCGKSLTALALMRLLPAQAGVSAGDVVLDGVSLPDLPEDAMCRVRGAKMAMIFQEPATALNPVMTVGEQIAEVIRLHENPGKDVVRQKVLQWLTRVGIDKPEERIDAFPFELSGGQKQRVLIAIALAGNPDVVIADEPTTALDVTLQAQILDLLKDLQKERNLALLLITHDLAVVKRYADRVALMYAGEIVEEAPCSAFFASPLHPYAAGLLSAVPSTAKRGQHLSGIAGRVPNLNEMPAGCRFADRCAKAREACRKAPVPQVPVKGGPDRRVRCLNPGRLPAAHADVTESPLTETGSHEVLRAEHLSVTFVKSRGLFKKPLLTPAVNDVTLTVREGETVALVGESGSGKTTLGKAVLRLIEGDVRITGRVVCGGIEALTAKGEDLTKLRRANQMIFQDPFSSLDPRMSVGESITEGMRALGIGETKEERLKRAAGLLERVGLPASAAERLPHEFSGGQRQRIAIARALAANPRLIICDEPTSALDVSVQAQILNLMKAIQKETGVAYLFITHNFAVVEYLADRVAVMEKGRLVEAGDAAEVLCNPQAAYTKRLLKAVPRLDL
ncbi:ABC transporter ATP-binding protein [Duodenibacillus massiliensis]|uniref:ABC transporter ATP-binding protein n=2 Tax=Duodenibacillus massiliensis TaxID=1852381 RepID=UPI00307AEC3D